MEARLGRLAHTKVLKQAQRDPLHNDKPALWENERNCFTNKATDKIIDDLLSDGAR